MPPEEPYLKQSPRAWMPTQASLTAVSALLVVAAAGCFLGLAFGDPEDERAELIYAIFLAVCLLGLAGVAWTANLRRRAIRQTTHELLVAGRELQTMDDNGFRDRYELLVGLGAYREAELVIEFLSRSR